MPQTIQKPTEPARRQPTATPSKLAKKLGSPAPTTNPTTPTTSSPSMNFLDSLTGYADDIGSLYAQFKGGSKVATPAPAPKPVATATDNKWLLIGGGLVAVVILVAVLFKK